MNEERSSEEEVVGLEVPDILAKMPTNILRRWYDDVDSRLAKLIKDVEFSRQQLKLNQDRGEGAIFKAYSNRLEAGIGRDKKEISNLNKQHNDLLQAQGRASSHQRVTEAQREIISSKDCNIIRRVIGPPVIRDLIKDEIEQKKDDPYQLDDDFKQAFLVDMNSFIERASLAYAGGGVDGLLAFLSHEKNLIAESCHVLKDYNITQYETLTENQNLMLFHSITVLEQREKLVLELDFKIKQGNFINQSPASNNEGVNAELAQVLSNGPELYVTLSQDVLTILHDSSRQQLQSFQHQSLEFQSLLHDRQVLFSSVKYTTQDAQKIEPSVVTEVKAKYVNNNSVTDAIRAIEGKMEPFIEKQWVLQIVADNFQQASEMKAKHVSKTQSKNSPVNLADLDSGLLTKAKDARLDFWMDPENDAYDEAQSNKINAKLYQQLDDVVAYLTILKNTGNLDKIAASINREIDRSQQLANALYLFVSDKSLAMGDRNILQQEMVSFHAKAVMLETLKPDVLAAAAAKESNAKKSIRERLGSRRSPVSSGRSSEPGTPTSRRPGLSTAGIKDAFNRFKSSPRGSRAGSRFVSRRQSMTEDELESTKVEKRNPHQSAVNNNAPETISKKDADATADDSSEATAPPKMPKTPRGGP